MFKKTYQVLNLKSSFQSHEIIEMPRNLSTFHELSDRSKRRRADEAGCFHYSYRIYLSDIEIPTVSLSYNCRSKEN